MNWSEHVSHRNQFPQEELTKYFGKHVAWSLDGTRIIASGEDDLEVFEAVKAAGQDTQQVVFSYVPFPDEIFLGGGILHDQEKAE